MDPSLWQPVSRYSSPSPLLLYWGNCSTGRGVRTIARTARGRSTVFRDSLPPLSPRGRRCSLGSGDRGGLGWIRKTRLPRAPRRQQAPDGQVTNLPHGRGGAEAVRNDSLGPDGTHSPETLLLWHVDRVSTTAITAELRALAPAQEAPLAQVPRRASARTAAPRRESSRSR